MVLWVIGSILQGGPIELFLVTTSAQQLVYQRTRYMQLGFFYMHHPTDRITHTTAFVTPVMEHWLEREIAQWVHPMKDRSDDPSHHERTLLPRSYLDMVCGGSSDQCLMVDPLSYFLFQPALHIWCHKGHENVKQLKNTFRRKGLLTFIFSSTNCMRRSGLSSALVCW